jgi:hypothetical protein
MSSGKPAIVGRHEYIEHKGGFFSSNPVLNVSVELDDGRTGVGVVRESEIETLKEGQDLGTARAVADAQSKTKK